MDKEDVVHISNGILLSHKNNEILQFAITWMHLEGIMLKEISQRKTNTVWFHLYVESTKQNRNSHRLREQNGGCHSYTIGRNVNWYSYYGEHYGGS